MTSAATLPAHRPATAQRATAAPTHATKPQRDTSVDTAVGILILLVVVIHAIGPLSERPAEALNQWLMTFIMPAFVFWSGYLTRRSSTWSPRQLAWRLLFPFVVFQVLHAVVKPLETGGLRVPTTLIAAWTTWYLLSLFVWRLVAPWLARIPAVVPLAVLVSLVAGLVPVIGPELSLGRTLGMLPFFALGLTWRREWFARLRTPGWRAAAVVTCVVSVALTYVTEPYVSRMVFYLHQDYASLDFTPSEGLIARVGALAAGFVLTLACVALTGWSSKVLARIGAASLVVYLLHPIALYPVRGAGYSDAIPELAWLGIIAAGTVLFALVVTLPVAVRATRPLMDYRWWTERKASR